MTGPEQPKQLDLFIEESDADKAKRLAAEALDKTKLTPPPKRVGRPPRDARMAQAGELAHPRDEEE